MNLRLYFFNFNGHTQPTLSLSLPFPHYMLVEGSGHRVGQLGSLQQSGHGDGEWRGQLVGIKHNLRVRKSLWKMSSLNRKTVMVSSW